MIVVLQVDDERGLSDIRRIAKREGLRAHLVLDEGLTEVDSGAATVLAVGPAAAENVNRVTGSLRLYHSPWEEQVAQLRRRATGLEKALLASAGIAPMRR